MTSAGKTRRALIWSLSGNYLAIAMQLTSMVITSRYLTPAEVGVYSIAMALISITQTLRDFGVAEFLITSPQISRERIRAAFTLNLIMSWSVALIILSARGVVSEFYSSPGVADVLLILSLNLMLAPFGAVTMAYLRRELRLREVMTASLLGDLTAQVVAITAVINGSSYMGLAWGSMAGMIVNVIVARVYRPSWFPRGPSLSGLSEALRFGANISVVYIVGQIGKNAPDLIIGRVLGEGAVGLFSRARGMLEVFSNTITSAVSRVALPHFAEAARDDQSVEREFNRVAEYLSGVGWLYSAAVSIGAHLLIGLLFGDKWSAASPYVSILAAAHGVEISLAMSKEYMISRGAVSQSARLQITNQALRIAACVFTAPFGLHAVCVGLVVASLLNTAATLWYMHRSLGFSVTAFLRSLQSSGLAMAGGYAVLYAASLAIDRLNVHVIFAAVLYAIAVLFTSLGALRIVRHPLYGEFSRYVLRPILGDR